MPAQVPNTNNNPGASLSKQQNDVADASIKNFLQGVNFPPATAEDRDKMKAAIEAFKAQIKKTKDAASKKAGTQGKTGKQAATKTLATQQVDKVGTDVPDIKKFLPAGTDLGKVSFDAAINAMQSTILKLETFIKSPATAVPTPNGEAGQQAANQVQNLSTIAEAAATAAQAAVAKAQLDPQKSVSDGGTGSGTNIK